MSRLTPESIRASQAELPPIGTVITELRRQDPYIQQEQHRYRSSRGFQSWPNHLAYAALLEAGLETMDALGDPVGAWAAATCQWARTVEAPPRFLAPELAEAFRRTSLPPLDEQLPLVLPCFRLMLPDGALFIEEKVPIPVVIVADLRTMPPKPHGRDRHGPRQACAFKEGEATGTLHAGRSKPRLPLRSGECARPTTSAPIRMVVMHIPHRSGPADLRSQLSQAVPADAGGFHAVREQQPQLLD